MADGKFTTVAATPRKANEYIASLKHLGQPQRLFDDYWREGEVTLFFGPSRTYKSILAMQIAESIARGHAIDGFDLESRRKKVLYADLKLSDKQFAARYAKEGRQYKFSENLYRQKPPKDEKLIEWLRRMVSEKGFRVIVLDDLSAVRMSYDGTRETLKMMRELKDLRDEFDLSILVIACSREQRPGELISEAHMMRSRVLCDEADSTFAIGVHPANPHYCYLTQTRTLLSAIKWHGNDVPVCSIQMSDDGLLSMAFDDRFVADIDEELRQMICNVKWARDAGASYRSIADDLGISKSKVARLFKKWTPALEKDIVIESEPPTLAGGKDQDFDATQQNESDADATEFGTSFVDDSPAPLPPTYAGGSDKIPFLAALKRIQITDLKHGVDGCGREIFIQEEQYDGKPVIWYQYGPKGKLIRKTRDSLGISIKSIEEPWISSVNLRQNGNKTAEYS